MGTIDWSKYRGILKRVYFHDGGAIRRDSPKLDEFWTFFNKYQSIMARKGPSASNSASCSFKDDFRTTPEGIPLDYSKHLKHCVGISLDPAERYMLREVPQEIAAEFEHVLLCYLEFLQKEKMTKLRNLRQSQRNLPIAQYREKIITTVRENQVIILAGDTGCGKSTQIPQYLMADGYEKIACTQPRRIAAISLAKRVAFETLSEFRTKIAFQIRFEKTKTMATKILFLTEGLLLRQLGTDPILSKYNVIILDEIHERNLHGDFLLGILKDVIKQRSDLKLILMSATINLELFSGYFKGAPVIQVPGRLYPIKLQYFPLAEKEAKGEKIDPGPYIRILQMIDSKFSSKEFGDLLIFLSGLKEISTIAESLKIYAEETKKWIILLLHSTLSLEEQEKVFDVSPEGVRKCILSTNICETSVTVDGVRFVADSGKAKEMNYDSSSKMHSLKEIFISKSSAEQRRGRAGRTGPGHCFRLYSPEQYAKFDQYSKSEIQRVSLESLVLQMYSLGLPDPRSFEFIEPPAHEKLEESIEYLKDQGALSFAEQLTPLGKILANLPVDVSVGKMLTMGCLFLQVEAVLSVAAAISVQSPFVNNSQRDMEIVTLRQNLLSDIGDPFTLLNVYREWLEVKDEGENTRKWCKKRGIEEQRLYEITKLRTQFKQLLEDSELMEKMEANLTDAERKLRHGELKRLKDLKRQAQNAQRKRKVLKLEGSYDAVMAEDAEETEARPDVNAVDFQMRHTTSQIRESLKNYRLDHSSATLLKLIVASALYPQVATLDEYNSCKLGTDQLAHTRNKGFVILHPTSSLAENPDVLASDAETVEIQKFTIIQVHTIFDQSELDS